MSARHDHAARVMAGVSEPMCWAALFDEIDQLRQECDLAVAHDTQPYPTAWAYEQACKALHTAKEAVAKLEEQLSRFSEEIDRLRDDDLFALIGTWHVRHADGSEEDTELTHGNLVENNVGTCGQFILRRLPI